MSCDSDADDELKLTKEYKYLLSYIRPLIDQLDKSKDAQLCLLWLSKLEQCRVWERIYRNKILSELCKQVKANCLKPPFNSPPTNGSLRSIICGDPDWRETSWNINECTELEASTEDDIFSTSEHSSLRNSRKRLGLDPSWNFYKAAKSKGSTKLVKEAGDHTECLAVQKAYQERAQSDQMVIERYQDIIKSLVSQQLKTDYSPNKLKKMQASYEAKMLGLVHSLKKVQEENELLKREIQVKSNSSNNKLEDLKNQNESLSKQVYELEAAKSMFEAKCKQIEEEKLMSLTELVNKLSESAKNLKESEKRYKSLERQLEENCRILESEHKTEISAKEEKYVAEIAELGKLLEEKQGQINKLKEQVASQSSSFQQEMSKLKQLVGNPKYEKDKKKIKYLKTKTRKLEKVREHMTVLFQSQLQEIVAKKDFYISTLEMQLKINTSDPGAISSGLDLDGTLSEKVSNLENQYRKLLEDSEQQSLKRRQLDLQKIHLLEKQVLLFGGAVEDIETNSNHLKTRSLTSVTVSESEIKTQELFNA